MEIRVGIQIYTEMKLLPISLTYMEILSIGNKNSQGDILLLLLFRVLYYYFLEIFFFTFLKT